MHTSLPISSLAAVCPSAILCLGDRLKVVCVDASSLTTQMVQRETVWNRPLSTLVRLPMGKSRFPVDIHLTVALKGQGALPDVAWTAWITTVLNDKFQRRFPAVMTRDVSERVSQKKAARTFALARDGRRLLAATLAQTGRIRRGDVDSATRVPMSQDTRATSAARAARFVGALALGANPGAKLSGHSAGLLTRDWGAAVAGSVSALAGSSVSCNYRTSRARARGAP
jgi:hypothetical protein